MKIALKVFKWIAGSVLGLIIVIGLCWWLIPDEELDAAADKFLTAANVPPAAKNAYFMIWGLNASPELDPHAVGQQIVAAHDRILAAEKDLSKFKPDAFYGDNPLKFPKDSKRLCDVEKENCLAVYQAKQAEVLAQSEEYKVFLARYRKIPAYEDFGLALSRSTHQSPIPSWNTILRLSDMVDGSIAARMKSKGTQQAALEELASEINSWRRLLQGNDWLVTQMISIAVLGRKYRLASEIMSAHPDIVAAYPALMAKITAPLSPADTSVVTSVAAEARLTIDTFRGMQAKGGFLEDSFFVGMPGPPLRAAFAAGGFRVNATLNDGFRYLDQLLLFLAESPKVVFDGHKALLEKLDRAARLSPADVFYNPVGRVMNGIEIPNYFHYVFRVNDLIGYSRLLDLQRRIIEANVGPDKVSSLLAGAGPGLTNPYTELPMSWDPTTKQVSFKMHGKRNVSFGYVTLDHLK